MLEERSLPGSRTTTRSGPTHPSGTEPLKSSSSSGCSSAKNKTSTRKKQKEQSRYDFRHPVGRKMGSGHFLVCSLYFYSTKPDPFTTPSVSDFLANGMSALQS